MAKLNPIEALRKRLPSEESIYNLAELFKMFGDSTRTKILNCLQLGDLNVGEISEILNMSFSAVSHQLRILRASKLVKRTKIGKEVKYSLNDEHVTTIMEMGMSHIKESE